MKRIKKNQIVVYLIALMLVVAGYLNYIENDKSVQISANTRNTTNIGDATLVSNNEMDDDINDFENKENYIQDNLKNDEVEEKTKIEDETINTNSNLAEDEYFANSKLEREKMYSQMLETYQNILENTTISEEQKSIATNEITKINNTRNGIMICENLITIKGFEEVVILANGDSINVIIKAKELETEEIAQIQNIKSRSL